MFERNPKYPPKLPFKGRVYAGKFRSKEELRKGLLNLAKLLGIDAEEALQIAEEDGMEDAYIRLQAGMGKALG